MQSERKVNQASNHAPNHAEILENYICCSRNYILNSPGYLTPEMEISLPGDGDRG